MSWCTKKKGVLIAEKSREAKVERIALLLKQQVLYSMVLMTKSLSSPSQVAESLCVESLRDIRTLTTERTILLVNGSTREADILNWSLLVSCKPPRRQILVI